MPSVLLTFVNPLNVSVQVGDTAYYCPTVEIASFPTAAQSTIVEIGVVTIVTSNTITCNIATTTPSPLTNSFIFFSKDNQANTSGLLGYYGSFKFVNNSTTEAELFSVGAEVFESSK